MTIVYAIGTNRAGAQTARRQGAEQQVKRTTSDNHTGVSRRFVCTYDLVTGFVMMATGRTDGVGGVDEVVVCRSSREN